MKKEVRIFLAALMFFTRIPVPQNNMADLNKAGRYFPLVGIIVGLIGAVVFAISALLFRDNTIAALLSSGATLLTTGAFHEDGLADVADGFGGGWTKARILEIMKDSRVGAYGVIMLIIVIGLKIALLSKLGNITITFGLIYVSAHAVSRIMPVFLLRFMRYAREEDTASKSKPLANKMSGAGFLVAITLGIIPLVILSVFTSVAVFLTLIPCGLLTLYLAGYFNKWINGYTGDCLGATQQLNEMMFYLSILLIWNYSL